MIDFAGNYRRLLYAALIALGLGFLIALLRGPVLDTAFSGGVEIGLHSAAPVDRIVLHQITEEQLGRPVEIALHTDTAGARYRLTAAGSPIDAGQLARLSAALEDCFLGEVEIAGLHTVAPAVARDFKARSLAGCALAALLLLFSLGVRYQASCGWSGAVAALAAQLYDAAWVLLSFLLFRLPLGPSTVAVLLVTLGSSLGNTLLVYDRIGENLRLHGDKLSPAELVNRSVNQSLSRAITATFTAGLVLLGVLLTAYLHRMDELVPLAFPSLVGMVAGLYSSLCLAPGLWCSRQPGAPESARP